MGAQREVNGDGGQVQREHCDGVCRRQNQGEREGIGAAAMQLRAVNQKKYVRRAVLVTFEATGAVDHGEALAGMHMGKSGSEIHVHTEHGLMKEWDSSDIDEVVKARNDARAEASKRSVDTRDEKPKNTPSKATKNKKATP
jgi:hypothetical protein